MLDSLLPTSIPLTSAGCIAKAGQSPRAQNVPFEEQGN